MNFICDKCKQKYHVADEKLQGRAVTRFRCKKCDHIIELEAPTQTSLGSAPPSPVTTSPGSSPAMRAATAAMPAARPSGKPRQATTSGPAFGAAGFGAPPGRAATMATPAARASAAARLDAPRPTTEHGWYAGIRDVPVGPLSRKDLVARIQSGEVTPDTLIWREGLDDWKPLSAVAEFADVGRAPAASATAAADAARQAASRASARPAVTDDDEEATRVAGLDPSLAGLMTKNSAASDRPASRGATESAAERPRPAAQGLSPLARPVARTTPTSQQAPAAPTPAALAPTPPASPAAERSEPAIAKPSGSAPRALPQPDARDLTPVPAKAAPEPPAPAKPASATASSMPSATASSAPSSQPEPKLATASELGITMRADSSAPPGADLLSPLAPPAPPQPAPLASPLAPPAPPQPAQPTTAKPAEPSRGMPAAAWVMMVGILVAGIGGGIYIGRLEQPSTAPPPPQRVQPRANALATDAGAHDAALTADADAAARSQAPGVEQSALALAPAQPASPRAEAALAAVRSSPVLRGCWQQAVAQHPELRATTVTLDLSVDTHGRFTRMDVTGSPTPDFAQCVSNRLAAFASIGDGDAADARTALELTLDN